MKKILMGEQFELIEYLVSELEDAVSFMETLEESEDDEARERREVKIQLIERATNDLKTLNKQYEEMLDEGEDDESYRICSDCGRVMTQGYCIESGLEYYCDKPCLTKNMTWEEFLELYDDGEGDSYWTQWEG